MLPSRSGTPRRSIDFTSALATLRRSASSDVGASTVTYSRSQLSGTCIRLSELPQHAQVVLPEHADVGDRVAELRNPLQPTPESEARPRLGVDPAVLEHGRIDHPRTAHLQPAGVAACATALATADPARYVRLDGRLREREVVRSEPDRAVLAEERAHDVQQRPLEVGEGDAAIDRKPFELVEDRVVRRVDRVSAVAAADRDHVDRRLALLHFVDLRRRRLRAKHDVAVQEERRARRASVVPRRKLELVEVVLGRLDLAVVTDVIAEPEERVLDLPPDLRDRVEVATRKPLAGKRDVDRLVQRLRAGGAPEGRLLALERSFDRAAHSVQLDARLAVADLAQR